MTRFFPYHDNLMAPLILDEGSEQLVSAYEKHKLSLNQDHKAYMGRSRVTTHSRDRGDRKGCVYCGRCLWGCPTESLYTPTITLRECLRFPNLTYLSNMWVSHFNYEDGRVTGVVAESMKGQGRQDFTADAYVLAAGTLSSSQIFMESIRRATGEIIQLGGLMDNRQVLIPFVNLRMLGKPYNPDTYQYHQLALGIETEKPEEYIHSQITTLKTGLAHPIIQNLPFDMQTSAQVFRNLRACLGVVNLNLNDRRRDTNYLTLKVDPVTGWNKLIIHYEPAEHEGELISKAVKRVSRILWKLGCVVPPWMVVIRPMGSSVHYSGTIPMSAERKPRTTSKTCQSHDFENLFFVDGTTIPFLPAKNITFTLMSNAVRVADTAF